MAKGQSRSRKATGKTAERTPLLVYVGIGAIALLVVAVLVRIGQSAAASSAPPVVAPPSFDSSVETGVTGNGDPYRGAAKAPVLIDIYEDMGCSHCRDFALNTEPQLEEQYIKTGKVRLVSHYIAIVNSNSVPGAEAAACAADQGRFWELRQLLFANQGGLFTRQLLVQLAAGAGLDQSAFAGCFDAQRHRTEIQQRSANAVRLGVKGTPTLFLGGERYEGAMPFVRAAPDAAGTPGLQALIEKQLGGG
ncbi:MAG: DsbA family protein [Chloroflexi bacterium]|nr:DsbA family protein [Chloroflexota bacterium]